MQLILSQSPGERILCQVTGCPARRGLVGVMEWWLIHFDALQSIHSIH